MSGFIARAAIETPDERFAKPPPVSLISEARRVESVAEHALAAPERRPNDLLQVFGAGRVHQGELGERRDRELLPLHQQPADLLAELGSSRLARHPHAKAPAL